MFRSLAFAGLIAAAAAPALAAPILPGYWESTDKITAPVQQTSTGRKCITAEQIESYLTGPVNNHYSCHYTDRKLGPTTFSMKGDCVDHNGIPAKVKVDGTYTATSFTMNGHLQIMLGKLAIPAEASTEAHRLSAECPAEATAK